VIIRKYSGKFDINKYKLY